MRVVSYFPIFKTCQKCAARFPCANRTQAQRNRYCSQTCIPIGRRHRKPPMVCPRCSREFIPKSHRARAKFCSGRCWSATRIADPVERDRMKAIAGLGSAARTPAGLAAHRAAMSGPRNHAWKGGVVLVRSHGNYKGARYVRCPDGLRSMSRKDGYLMEHRMVVALAIGRTLERVEAVHHRDHNPANNAVENLMLFACNRDHKLYEWHGLPLPIWSGASCE